MTAALEFDENQRACLLVAHDGIDPDVVDGLVGQVAGLVPASGAQTARLAALMRCWQILSGFGPLKGHRDGPATPGPNHPWYGAKLTDPDSLLERFRPALFDGQGPMTVWFESRQVFWTWEEAREFCAFFLRVFPDGYLVLAEGAEQALTETFATRSGWSREASREAVRLMSAHMTEMAACWPDRCLRWDVTDGGAAAIVAGNLPGVDRG